MPTTATTPIDFLASMVAGLGDTHALMGADRPEISMDEIKEIGDSAIAANIYLPDGEAFTVAVWPKDSGD